jgi:hypothetical protein
MANWQRISSSVGADVTGGPGPGIPAAAGNVTGLQVIVVHVERKGKIVRQLHCKCTPPGGTFRGIELWLEEPDMSATAQLVADGATAWDGTKGLSAGFDPKPGPRVPYALNETVIFDDLEPVTEPTECRVYFNSYNTGDVSNALVRANLTSPTPSIAVTVNPPDDGNLGSGEEFAPNALTFSAPTVYHDPNPGYSHTDGGQQDWFVSVDWTDNTTHPRFKQLKGYRLQVEDLYEQRIVDDVDLGKLLNPYTYNALVPDPARTYRLWLVPYSSEGVNNRRLGITRHLDVYIERSIGIPGEEFCPNPINPTVEYVGYGLNGSGQYVGYADLFFTRPADVRYGSALITVRVDGIHKGNWFAGEDSYRVEFPEFPSSPTPVEIRFRGVSTNNRTNTEVEGVTPEVNLTLDPPPLGTGGVEHCLNPSFGSPPTTLQYRVTGDGLEEWRLMVKFTPPNDTRIGKVRLTLQRMSTLEYEQPEYYGISDLIVYTAWRSIVSGATYTLWMSGVDVNGNENQIVDTITPEVSGISPTLQTAGSIEGGRIKQGTILSVAAFAANIMPPEVVASLPTPMPNAVYPSGRQVVLTTDNKIYRSTGTGWTKVVDGGDIIAGSILAASIAAGAIATHHFAAQEVLVGSGGGKPSRFAVKDSFGNYICLIGDDPIVIPGGFTGGFFKRIKIANTVGATSNYIDANGTSLVINGASFSLSSGNVVVNIDSTNYIKVSSTPSNRFCQMDGSGFRVESTVNNSTYAQVIGWGFSAQFALGGARAELHAFPLGGSLALVNSFGITGFRIDAGDISATTASPGGLSLPVSAAGFLKVVINNVNYRIPYYLT